MFVIPVGKVRDPLSKQHLPATGANVPDTVYWQRRLAAGEVKLAPAKAVLITQIPDYKGDH